MMSASDVAAKLKGILERYKDDSSMECWFIELEDCVNSIEGVDVFPGCCGDIDILAPTLARCRGCGKTLRPKK